MMSDCLHESCKDGQKQGEVQNQGQQNRKDREELVDDLADCLAQLQDDSDIERIDRILEELEQMGPARPDFDTEQSLARFYQKYGEFFSAQPSAEKVKKPKRRKNLRRIARIAAIIAVLLVVSLGAAQAAGFNILGIFPWWNGERFHFTQEEDNVPQMLDSLPDIEFESLQAALDAYDIDIPLAPSDLPDEAELQTLFVDEHKGQLVFSAGYNLPDGELFITIKQTAGVPYFEVEKKEDDAEIYTVDGVEHLIMDDIGRQKAVWYNGMWEENIIGDVAREDLIAMIDSIYR